MSAIRPGVVLVHGATLNRHMWDPVVAALGGERLAVLDLPGHGSRRHEPFTLTAAVGATLEAAGTLGQGPVVLVGDSLGSYVSLAAASRLGARLVGAVLGGGTADFQRLTVSYRLQMGLLRLIPEQTLRARLEQRIRLEFPGAIKCIEAGVRPAAFGEAVGELRRFDSRAAFRTVSAPIVFVNGTRDGPHRRGEATALAACHRATLKLFEGDGHGVTLIRPAEFAAIVRALLETIAANGPA